METTLNSESIDLSKEDLEIPRHCWRGNRRSPKLLVVVDKPSPDEYKTLIGFTSDAARLLEHILKEGGLDCGETLDALDEAVRYCRDQKMEWDEHLRDSLLEGLAPGDVFYLHYMDGEEADSDDAFYAIKAAVRFHKLVLEIKPKHILVLSPRTAKALINRGTNGNLGAVFQYDIPQQLKDLVANKELADQTIHVLMEQRCNIPLSVDLHPFQVANQQKQLNGWMTRLQDLCSRLGEWVVKKPVEVKIFYDFQEAKDFLISWINDPTLRKLSYDWETRTLAVGYFEYPKHITITINLARDDTHGYVVPTWHPDVQWTDAQRIEICGLIGQLLMKERDVTIGHHLQFDNLVSRFEPHLNIGRNQLPGEYHDCMYFAYCNDEAGTQRLKELCNLYTDLHSYDDELEQYREDNEIDDYSKIPLQILGKYGGYDAVGPIRLQTVLKQKLDLDKRGPLYSIATKLMGIQLWAIENIAYNGQHLDEKTLFEEGAKHERLLSELVIELMSSPEMQEFVHDRRIQETIDFCALIFRQPVNLWKKFKQIEFRKIITKIEEKQYHTELKAVVKSLKAGDTTIDEYGIIYDRDKNPIENWEFYHELYEAVFEHKWKELDPANDDLTKWRPWLKDNDYVATEESGIDVESDEVETFEMVQDDDDKRYHYEGTGYKPNFNTNGAHEMGDFFFKHLSIPIIKKTEKGNPSLGKEARPFLIAAHPLAKTFFDYKDHVKEYGVYFKRFIVGFRERQKNNDTDKIDGERRAHLWVHIGKTVTGRSTAALLQLLPRKGSVKRIYNSRFEPGLVVMADMSQAELRVGASIANEQAMIQAYLNDEDLHTLTMNAVYSLAFIEKQTEETIKNVIRPVAKQVNFLCFYGGGGAGLLNTLKKGNVEVLVSGDYNVDEVYESVCKRYHLDRKNMHHYAQIEEHVDKLRLKICNDIINKFFDRYNGLKTWIESVHEFVERYGYYYSPLGRLRRLSGIYSSNNEDVAEAKRQAVNFPVQSSASDLALIALAAIQKDLNKYNMRTVPFAAVHDSIELDAPLDEVQAAAEILSYRLNDARANFRDLGLDDFDTNWIKVPLKSDVHIGHNWADVHTYKDGQVIIAPKKNKETGITTEERILTLQEFYEFGK